MLKVTLLELVVRGIPEGLLFILLTYAFSKRFIHTKRYLVASVLYSVGVYLIRLLPIQTGADFILNLVLLITLTVMVNKIEIIKAIKAGIVAFLLGFVSEGVNFFFVQFILKKDMNVIFNNPVLKVLYASPSIIFFGCIVITYYIMLRRRKELKYE